MRKVFFIRMFIALFIVSEAQAALVQWELQNVVFDDGGTATGSFSYDSNTNIYSNISITTTLGSARSGAFYEYLHPFIPQNDRSLFLVATPDTVTGTPIFALSFVSPLTNAGGTSDFVLGPSPSGLEASCRTDHCSRYAEPVRRPVSGIVFSSVIPLPATVWLFSSALGLLAGCGWRRKSPQHLTGLRLN